MKKFMFIYKGGGKPETEEEGAKVMAAWGAWMQAGGEAIVDFGAPLVNGQNVGAESVTGYSIVQAEDMEGAMALEAEHPHKQFGGSVEVYEIEPIEM